MAQTGEKVKKRGPLFLPLTVLLIAVAMVFALSVFFRVNEIVVEGNQLYSADEIIEASGIEKGDNLFFINRGGVYSRIYSHLPYIETAGIRLRLPSRLILTVTESDAIAYVTAENAQWVIDRGCKILSQASAGAVRGLIRVDGLTPVEPMAGNYLDAGAADAPKTAYLGEILRQISALGLTEEITWIDMSNPANPRFDYLGRFTVKLGTDENVAYKFQLLLSAAAKLADGDRGTLDLSIDRQVHLVYD